MVKKSNPWLLGLLRAGKKQQRSVVRAIGKLLAPPKPNARPKPRAKPRLATVPTTIAPLKPRGPRPATAAPATGKWLASYLSGFTGRGSLRRLSYWLYLPDRRAPKPPRGAACR
jgi:hypothetical protein